MKKYILSGLYAGLVMFAIAMVFSQLSMMIPILKTEYANIALYRQMNDPRTLFFFIHPFLLGFILAFIWDRTENIIQSPKGIVFGLMYFLIVMPGLLISYACSPYSLIMVLFWSITVLFQGLSAGSIFQKLDKLL